MTQPNEQLEGTELDSQSPESSTVEHETAEAQSQEETIQWTREMEDSFNNKVESEGYEPTDAELDSYEQWIKDGKPNPEPEDEAVEDKNLEATESDADSGESKNDSSSQYSEDEIKDLTSAMEAVGAKTINELPDKIAGLRSLVGKQGGEMGTQLKTAQEQLDNMANLMKDLGEGKPEAIEYMRQNGHPTYGQNAPSAPQPAKNQEGQSSFDFENALDPDMAAYVRSLESTVNELKDGFQSIQGSQKAAQEKAAQYAAVEQTVSEISQFVSKYPSYYDAAADVSDLTRQYYHQDSEAPVDPRLTKIHELLDYARNNNLKNLEDAHLLMNRENYTQQLVEAENRGRQSAYQKPTTVSASSRRNNQGKETQYQKYSEQEVEDFAYGRKEMPMDWTNDDGSWNWSAIPQSAYKYIGQKPPA